MQPKILHNWEEMWTELDKAKDGHVFHVERDHNAFLLKQAIDREGLENTTVKIVRGDVMNVDQLENYIKEVSELTQFMEKNDFWSTSECDNWRMQAVRDYETNPKAAHDFLNQTQLVIEKIIKGVEPNWQYLN